MITPDGPSSRSGRGRSVKAQATLGLCCKPWTSPLKEARTHFKTPLAGFWQGSEVWKIGHFGLSGDRRIAPNQVMK
jgi:hypothetical protein